MLDPFRDRLDGEPGPGPAPLAVPQRPSLRDELGGALPTAGRCPVTFAGVAAPGEQPLGEPPR